MTIGTQGLSPKLKFVSPIDLLSPQYAGHVIAGVNTRGYCSLDKRLDFKSRLHLTFFFTFGFSRKCSFSYFCLPRNINIIFITGESARTKPRLYL